MTGYPWASGDALLAHDLNAAIANSVALGGGMLPLDGHIPMTGPLTLSGNATLPLHAVPLQQVNTAAAGGPFLPLAGGTVTGATTLSGAGTMLSVTSNASIGGTLSVPTIKGPTGGSIVLQPATSTTIAMFLDSANGANSNYLRFQNGAAGTGPTIRGIGVDANQNINYQANGTGYHNFLQQAFSPSFRTQQTVTFSGAQTSTQYGFNGNITVTGGSVSGPVTPYLFGVTDSADASGAPDSTLRGFRQSLNMQAGFKGGRYAAEIDFNMPVSSANTVGSLKQYCGILHSATASATDGGTALINGSCAGGLTATNSFTILYSGATFWQYMTGHEIDMVCQAGASVYNKTGLAIVQQNGDAVNGVAGDSAIGIASNLGATVRWFNALSLGGVGGDWPLDATRGSVISVLARQYTGTPGTAFRVPQALNGIDLSKVECSRNAFASPNFAVTGAGAINLGVGVISSSGTAMSIDAANKYVSSAVVASSAGGNNVVGDRLYGTDGYGDVYSVATVISGAVATVTVIAGGSATGTPAANVTTIGGSGGAQAVVLTRTWTAGTTISLNPTGKQVLTNLAAATTDAAAATAGVPINGLYNNAGVVHVRLT